MSSNDEDKSNDLKSLNDEFKELIDLIEKEKSPKFSMKPFDKLNKMKRSSKKNWFILCSIAFIFLGGYVIFSNEELSYEIYFFCLSFLRMFLIKILPYWDWTYIYTAHCFVANPYCNYTFEIMECNKCANTTEVVRQSNITFFNFTKNIYLNHVPVVIEDATESWPAMKELTVKSLFQLFVEDPILSENDICYFESNIGQYNRPGGADKLFHDYLDGNRRSFRVHWNNCKRETLKVIRSYYSKPYFLPPSVSQTLVGNWFLASSGLHKGAIHLTQIPLASNWAWLAQIHGSSMVELRPKRICEGKCSILRSVTLNKGDLIMYSHLYDAFYSPVKKESLLLGQGVD